jgi:hypothetical protein
MIESLILILLGVVAGYYAVSHFLVTGQPA